MIAIVARMKVADGKDDAFRELMGGLAAKVRELEPGCLHYQLCSAKAPGEYVMIERYASKEALGEHAQTEHFKAAMVELGGLLDGQAQIEVLKEIA